MFGSRHFQALKNDQSVGRPAYFRLFFTFYIFNFFYTKRGKLKTRKEVSDDLFRDLKPLPTLQTAKNTCGIVLY